MQTIRGIQTPVRASGQGGETFVVRAVGEAGIVVITEREAIIKGPGLTPMARGDVTDAIAAIGQTEQGAGVLRCMTSNDIDHAEKRIRPERGSIRAAHHFYALNIFQRERQARPGNLSE